jgi:hypothetical protein
VLVVLTVFRHASSLLLWARQGNGCGVPEGARRPGRCPAGVPAAFPRMSDGRPQVPRPAGRAADDRLVELDVQ